ncbi:helix-turn-helix domain-containing protein [Paracoccus sp. p4-l81]|uniref:helix-turn-helix domain-containing protein n=1 Tax=Paracoccus sp. p4-l81 TaxID=3342806 RepID=UPI0035B7D67D
MPQQDVAADAARSFDDFELRLGDVMRGERATLSKSLLDVQRELRIKASYIAAIENTDISAFDAPSFIAGYVRSYARYLGMDPDWAFDRFCRESGFQPVHGMAAAASGPKPQRRPSDPIEALANPNPLFLPPKQSFWAQFEPRALGSILVLGLLVAGVGYGGWSVLQEVQKVHLAAVDQAPGVVGELDPLDGALKPGPSEGATGPDLAMNLPQPESIDRTYRPQALDVPQLTARDEPISALDPAQTGALAGLTPPATTTTPADPATGAVLAEATQPTAPGAVRTIAADAPEVEILAVRPSWVRVQGADGTVIFEKILDAGERFALPKLEQPPVLRAGNSGSVYFAVNGQTYGPAAPGAQVVKNLELSPAALTGKYALADMTKDEDLARLVAQLTAMPGTVPGAAPAATAAPTTSTPTAP